MVSIASRPSVYSSKVEEVRQREVRDLLWRKYQTIVVAAFYRVRCPRCGLRVETVPQLPSKAPSARTSKTRVGLGPANRPRRAATALRVGRLPCSSNALYMRLVDPFAEFTQKPPGLSLAKEEPMGLLNVQQKFWIIRQVARKFYGIEAGIELQDDVFCAASHIKMSFFRKRHPAAVLDAQAWDR
jgi:hypothetical protein